MGLELPEQAVIVKKNIKFDECHVIGGARDSLKAIISFVVLDDDGNRVDTKVLTYDGQDYNSFWQNFNSGQFIYEQLVAKESLQIQVTSSVENDFLNTV